MDMTDKPRIGIIIGTTRPARFGHRPAEWFYNIARQRDDAEFEIVDLRDYDLPLFAEDRSPIYAPSENPEVRRWSDKIASLDGYIFVTAEYNHSISAALKNALDSIYPEFGRKPASFVGYGATGGSRAVEHLRGILAELHVATLKQAVHIGMTEMLGFLRDGKTFADFPYLDETTGPVLNDIVWWSRALRTARAA